MRTLAFVLLCAMIFIGCRDNQTYNIENPSAEKRKIGQQFTQETITIDRPSSNVDITSYILITDDVQADRSDAQAIMQLRAKLPLAVQTKDAALFDNILAREFIYRAEDEFWNRKQYIRARVEEPEKVESARYENLVLQVFGDIAVSTYRNVVQLKDPSGRPMTLKMTWASVYLKESGEWKVGAVHLIDKKFGD